METTAGEVGTNGNAVITENLKHASQRKQLKWAKGSKNAEAVIYKVPLRNTPVRCIAELSTMLIFFRAYWTFITIDQLFFTRKVSINFKK